MTMPVQMPGPPPCPYCGRAMSEREAQEQHACTDCYDSGRFGVQADTSDDPGYPAPPTRQRDPGYPAPPKQRRRS